MRDKPLKLTCGLCGGSLNVIGQIKHNLHTVCAKCGADSNPQTSAFKKKGSGEYAIPVVRIKRRA